MAKQRISPGAPATVPPNRIAAIENLSEAKAKKLLHDIFVAMYWDNDQDGFNPDHEIQGANFVDRMMELMPVCTLSNCLAVQ